MPKIIFEYEDTRIVDVGNGDDVDHVIERRTKDAMNEWRWNTMHSISVRSVKPGNDDRQVGLSVGLYTAILAEIDALTKALQMAKQELSQEKEQQSFEP